MALHSSLLLINRCQRGFKRCQIQWERGWETCPGSGGCKNPGIGVFVHPRCSQLEKRSARREIRAGALDELSEVRSLQGGLQVWIVSSEDEFLVSVVLRELMCQ